MRRSPTRAARQQAWSRAPLASGIVALLAVMVSAVLYDALRPRVALQPEPEPLLAAAAVVPVKAPAVEAVPVVEPPPPPAAASVATPAATYPKNPAQLVRALAPLQREVTAGLASLDRSSGCAWGELFARLTLVTGEAEVKVEAIEVLRRPPPPDPDAPDHDPAAFAPREVTDEAAAACVRLALADKSWPAPSAKPGRRWQTSYAPGAHP